MKLMPVLLICALLPGCASNRPSKTASAENLDPALSPGQAGFRYHCPDKFDLVVSTLPEGEWRPTVETLATAPNEPKVLATMAARFYRGDKAENRIGNIYEVRQIVGRENVRRLLEDSVSFTNAPSSSWGTWEEDDKKLVDEKATVVWQYKVDDYEYGHQVDIYRFFTGHRSPEKDLGAKIVSDKFPPAPRQGMDGKTYFCRP